MDKEIELININSDKHWQEVVNNFQKKEFYIKDLIPDQLNELTELGRFDESYLPNKKDLLGVAIIYQLLNKVIRILPRESFMRLLCSRNRNLINNEEQKKFSSINVAVAGLSVGSNICRVMAMQGGSMKLSIADADVISTSNLNRISASLFDVGEKKAVALERQLLSINPYIKIRAFSNGINEKVITDFALNADIIFDEVDDLPLKLSLRNYAKKMSLPLIMITDNGDNVMVDIERFDKNQNLLPFHGLLSRSDLSIIEGSCGKLSPQDRVKLSLKIVQPHNAVQRMQDSLLEVGTVLNTWPQLGTAANLAGVVGSYIVRKIALNELLVSGRHQVSIDERLMIGHGNIRHRIHHKMHTNKFIHQLRRCP